MGDFASPSIATSTLVGRGTGVGCDTGTVGSGVSVTAITSTVDKYLLQDLVGATSTAAAATTTESYADKLQNLLGATTGGDSGGTSLAPKGVDRGRIAPGATLAISVEPRGGSPTGLPTGPVVATGVVARV